MKNELFKQLDIWKYSSDKEAYCYRVFQRLSDEYYAVQSKDGFSLPINNDALAYFNAQLIELFLDTNIVEREKFYPTIEEAIEQFDLDFCS